MTDQHHYDIVAGELQQRVLKPGLWARAIAESGGDEEKARAFYIRFRVTELKDEERERTSRMAQEAKAFAHRHQLEQELRSHEKEIVIRKTQRDIRDGKAVVCTACGRECAPQRLDKGFLVIAAGLSLCCVVPGVLYLLFAKGHIFRCEHCRATLYTQWV